MGRLLTATGDWRPLINTCVNVPVTHAYSGPYTPTMKAYIKFKHLPERKLTVVLRMCAF